MQQWRLQFAELRREHGKATQIWYAGLLFKSWMVDRRHDGSWRHCTEPVVMNQSIPRKRYTPMTSAVPKFILLRAHRVALIDCLYQLHNCFLLFGSESDIVFKEKLNIWCQLYHFSLRKELGHGYSQCTADCF